MVTIEDCFSTSPLPQPLKGDARQQVDLKCPDADQSKGKENQVPVILAKAALAAKIQIVAGMGKRDNTADPADLSMKQRVFNEDDMALNLRGIVADDKRWELFALGALGLQPDSESSNTVRDCLLKGFEENAWDGIENLVAQYSESEPSDENDDHLAPRDHLSDGLIERTKLWLAFPNYFEILFSAVREKNLSNNIDLYTDDLLIKYLHTIGQ
jgi:hypothetical protein